MSKSILIIAIILALLPTGRLAAQKPATNGHLNAREAKEIIREHLREMQKEKIRGYEQYQDRGKVQMKTTVMDQQVSSSPDEQAEVSLAVHPMDSNKVVLSFMDQGTTMPLEFPIYYSSDGGKTWNVSGFSPLDQLMNKGYMPIGGGDPVFAWDKNGRVYMSWLYIGMTMQMDTGFAFTFWAYSDDNGANWQMEPGLKGVIAMGAMDPFTQQMYSNYFGMADRQWLAVDNSNGPGQGTLYCSSFFVPGDEDPNKVGVLVQVKTPSANSFNTGTLAYNGSTQFANVEVDHSGTLHVSFADLGADEILHVSSSNTGQSFSSPHLVGTGSNLFGGMGLIHDRENAATNMAIGKNNDLHVVWGDFTSVANTFYSYSTDGGNSWSTPLDINSKYNFAQSMMPTVAADNGVSVFFTGISNADSANYYEINADNGTNFGTAMKISSGTTYYPEYISGEFFGDYNRAVRYNRTSYAAWTDGRNSMGPKVFFARTQSYPDAIPEVTAIMTKVKVGALYPNPAADVLHFGLETATTASFVMTVTDVTGKILWSKTFDAGAGKNDIELPVSGFTPGNQVLRISGKEGLIATRPFTKL